MNGITRLNMKHRCRPFHTSLSSGLPCINLNVHRFKLNLAEIIRWGKHGHASEMAAHTSRLVTKQQPRTLDSYHQLYQPRSGILTDTSSFAPLTLPLITLMSPTAPASSSSPPATAPAQVLRQYNSALQIQLRTAAPLHTDTSKPPFITHPRVVHMGPRHELYCHYLSAGQGMH